MTFFPHTFTCYSPVPYPVVLHKSIFFFTQCSSTGNTGQHSALTEEGAKTLDVLGINLSSDDFSVQVPQLEVTDLQNDQKAILSLWLLVVCIVLISMYICCNVLNFSINVFDKRVVHIFIKKTEKVMTFFN